MKTAATKQRTLDRYRSFCGLDCQARAEHLVKYICTLSRQQEADNPFWALFTKKAEAENGPDALLLVHTTVFYMRELLEKHQDSKGLKLLDEIETDCC